MKKIVVTDPCYLFSSEDWAKLIDGKEGDNLAEAVKEALVKNSGDKIAVVGSTGVGDWTNRMTKMGDPCDIVSADFAADAGMVCVVEWTKELHDYLVRNNVSLPQEGCIARLDVPNEAFYELNFMGDFTKVNIWLGEFENLLAQSRTEDEEDGETAKS